MTDSFISKNKTALIVTMIFLIIGITAYFFWVPRYADAGSESSIAALNLLQSDAVQFKVAYTTTGDLKIFTLAKNSDLAKLKTVEGYSIPEYNSVVIGSAEAGLMKEESLFNKTNDKLTDFFGTNVLVSGILTPTMSPVDEMHFVSDSNFATLEGESNKLFVRIADGKMAKLFYTASTQEIANSTKLKLALSEGDFSNYRVSELAGITYYPVLVGANEAAIMREEKLFSNVGDTIRGFFGNNIVIVGILAKTNTPLDTVHLLPLSAEQVK